MLDGPAAVLEPRTRRPGSSPTKLSDEVKAQAIQVRAALESSGLDHGPISVHDKMKTMGLAPAPRVTPLTAWEATAKAEPPRPRADQRPWFDRPVPTRYLPPQLPPPTDLPTDTRVRKVSTAGTINVDKVFYKIDVEHRFTQVLVITDGDNLTITDLQGELLAEHTRPGPGVTYVGNGRPPGPRPKNT